MIYDPLTDAWASYDLALFFKRLSLQGKGWFRNPVELYALEAGPLFSFVSGVVR